jgi:hypothetical protein
MGADVQMHDELMIRSGSFAEPDFIGRIPPVNTKEGGRLEASIEEKYATVDVFARWLFVRKRKEWLRLVFDALGVDESYLILGGEEPDAQFG